MMRLMVATAVAVGAMNFSVNAQEAAANSKASQSAKAVSEAVDSASLAMAAPDVAAKARKSGEKKKAALSGSYHDIIARHAAANGVPVELAHAVVRVESNYRADARGKAGEVGLMQIKPATARGLGYSGSTKGLYDPETNIRWGMKYLGMAYKLGGGSTCGTILKYNAGHGAKRMNPVSKRYCGKVQALLS